MKIFLTILAITMTLFVFKQMDNSNKFNIPNDVDFSPLPYSDSSGQWYDITNIRAHIKKYVLNKNFEKLEERVLQARSQRLRFNTVNWVLYDLYKVIASSLNNFNDTKEFIALWRSKFPRSNIPDILEARVNIDKAWEARGNGFDIPDDQYDTFKLYLYKAWESTEMAETKGSNDAELCRLQTDLSFVYMNDKKLAKQYFHKCLTIEPGYTHLYFTMNTYLQPYWYGTREEQISFVNEISDAGYRLYHDGLYSLLVAASTFYTNKIFEGYGGNFSWQRTQSGFKDIFSQYGKSSYISHAYAYCAMLAHDHQVLASILKEIGTQWDDEKANYFKKKTWYDFHLKKAQKFL